MRFKSTSSDQIFLLPPTLDELVPRDSLARIVTEVVDKLDLAPLYSRCGTGGRPPYNPKMMLRVLFYAYSQGVFSSRKIAQRLEQDTHFMFLSGMETPDFRTISDFRKNNLDVLHDFFKQIVLYCIEIGMVSLGHIAIDGTKIKASASKKHSRDAESLQKEIAKIEEEISGLLAESEKIDQSEDKKLGKNKRGDEIPQEIQDKLNRKERLEEARKLLEERGWNKINLTDADSRFMQDHSTQEICYNAQIAADYDNQVIVANDVVTEANDNNQFIPMYEQTVNNTGKTPDAISTDKGYSNHKNFKYITVGGINAYVPTNQESTIKKNKFTKDKFRYDTEHDLYICPEGRELHYFQAKQKDGVAIRVYRCSDCSGCSAAKQCLQKNNKSGKRAIKIYETDLFINKLQEKLKSESGKKEYNKRRITVEPPFGNIKHNMAFREFLLRGHKKVRGEFDLICIAHNLKKISAFKKKKKLEIQLAWLFLYSFFIFSKNINRITLFSPLWIEK